MVTANLWRKLEERIKFQEKNHERLQPIILPKLGSHVNRTENENLNIIQM